MDSPKKLNELFWDYNITPEHITNARAGKGWDNQEFLLRRLFEQLDWYELVHWLGWERIAVCLTSEFIRTLRTPDLREKYEFVRCVLHGETPSVSGWSDENRQRRTYALLSDRWNRS